MKNNYKKLVGGGLKSESLFDEIISFENIYLSWKEFKKGKSKKWDVQQFELDVENNLVKLHQDLQDRTYQHSRYFSFYIKDPKLRHIHKATVRDRVLHHTLFRVLYPLFDPSFIFDSYSSRNEKGTHKAVNRLHIFFRKISKNNTKKCFVLKRDIKKFFDSIDQKILIILLQKKIHDKDLIRLLEVVISSFNKGIPLGNVTSQLFANIYLNELDQYMKRILKIKYYIRYCDDFVILSSDKLYLESLIFKINNFLENHLNLSLHPNKIIMRKYHQGIDFLGYVNFPYHRVLRTKTKQRMFRKIQIRKKELSENRISETSFNQTLQSYFGILKHCSGFKVKKIIDLS